MINQYQVRDAMKLLEELPSLYDKEALYFKQSDNGIRDQLALSLKTYLDRGEYHHGNFKEAVMCLNQACYEIEII